MAEFVHYIADTVGDGEVTLEDFGTYRYLRCSFPGFLDSNAYAILWLAEVFCDEIAEVYRNDEWRLGSGDQSVKNVDRQVFDQVVERVSDLENMPDLAER